MSIENRSGEAKMSENRRNPAVRNPSPNSASTLDKNLTDVLSERFAIPGVTLEEVVDIKQDVEGAHEVLFRGITSGSGKAVLVKVFVPAPHGAPIEVLKQRCYEEFSLSELSSRIRGVLPIDSICVVTMTEPDFPSLWYNDCGGVPLDTFLQSSGSIDLPTFFNIFIPITETIASLHDDGVIHRNINPRSIMYDADNKTTFLTDLRFACLSTNTRRLQVVCGTLCYLSPEQTGRTRLPVDFRSDLYSLGCTMFEVLTGTPMFETTDPMTLIHRVLAISPPLVTSLRKDVPALLSLIVQRLVEKDPQRRYQSASGLLNDLKRLVSHEDLATASFALAQYDGSASFNVSNTIRGRERHLDMLIAQFEACQGTGSAIVDVQGPRGSGKTTLVSTFMNLVKDRALCIEGRCTMYENDVPYTGLRAMLYDIVSKVRTLSTNELERVKSQFMSSGGRRYLVNLISIAPELQAIFPIHEADLQAVKASQDNLSSTEAKKIMSLSFVSLLQALSSLNQTLVIFQDDVQWADVASSAILLDIMLNPHTQNLMIVLGYRDTIEEVNPAKRILPTCASRNVSTLSLELSGLGVDDISQLVCDTLGCSPQEGVPLAKYLFEMTNGNPFHVKHMLYDMESSKNLFYDHENRNWRWNLDNMEHKQDVDIIKSLQTRLESYSDDSLTLLRMISILGSPFCVRDLCKISELDEATVRKNLMPFVEGDILVFANAPFDYDFTHCNLFEASRGMLSQDKIHAYSLLVARCFTQGVDAGNFHFLSQNRLFSIAHHLSNSLPILTNGDLSSDELLLFARLLMQSCSCSIIASAFDTAQLNIHDSVILFLYVGLEAMSNNENLQLLMKSVEELNALVDPSTWVWTSKLIEVFCSIEPEQYPRNPFDLAYKAVLLYSKCLYHTSHIDVAVGILDCLLQHIQSDDRRVLVHQMKFALYHSTMEYAKGLQNGVDAIRLLFPKYADPFILKLIGGSFPLFPEQEHVNALVQNRIPHNMKLRGISNINELLHLPRNSDPHLTSLTKLLIMMIPSAYMSKNMNLYVFLCSAAVNLSLMHGNTAGSSDAYSVFGFVQATFMGKERDGCSFSRVGAELGKTYGSDRTCASAIMHYGMGSHFTQHASVGVALLQESMHMSRLSGDLAGEAHSMNFCAAFQMIQGVDVEKQLCDALCWGLRIQESGLEGHALMCLGFVTGLRDLLGDNYLLSVAGPGENGPSKPMTVLSYLTSKGYDSDKIEADSRKNIADIPLIFGFFALSQIHSRYALGRFDATYDICLELKEILSFTIGMQPYYEFHFYYPLILLRLLPKLCSAGRERDEVIAEAREYASKVSKWAELNPGIYLARKLVLEAELLSVEEKHWEALALFEQAMDVSEKHCIPHVQAIVWERAANIYELKGLHRTSTKIKSEVTRFYQQWGAAEVLNRWVDCDSSSSETSRHNLMNLDMGNSVESGGHFHAPHSPVASSSFMPLDIASNGATLSGINSQSSSAPNFPSSLGQNISSQALIEAVQNLSSFTNSDQVLCRFMKLALNFTGASKGVLLMTDDGEGSNSSKLQCVAFGDVDDRRTTWVTERVPMETAGSKLPLSLVRHAAHSMKVILVDNLSSDPDFEMDPYVRGKSSLSALCIPILKQQKVVGVLYVENSLCSKFFCDDMVHVLDVMATQVVITLENIRVYQNLESLVKKRTMELAKKERIAKLSSNRVHHLISCMTEGIILADGVGKVQLKNEALAKTFALTDDLLEAQRHDMNQSSHSSSIELMDVMAVLSTNVTHFVVQSGSAVPGHTSSARSSMVSPSARSSMVSPAFGGFCSDSTLDPTNGEMKFGKGEQSDDEEDSNTTAVNDRKSSPQKAKAFLDLVHRVSENRRIVTNIQLVVEHPSSRHVPSANPKSTKGVMSVDVGGETPTGGDGVSPSARSSRSYRGSSGGSRRYNSKKSDNQNAMREAEEVEDLIILMDYIPLFYGDTFHGAIWVFKDITAQSLMQKKIWKAAVEARNEFLSFICHEIRNPLNGCVGMAGLLAETPLQDEQKEYVQALSTSCDLMCAIINDVLDFSKIQAGHIELEIIPFSVPNLLNDVVKLQSMSRYKKDLVALVVEADVPEDLWVMGDPLRLSQVLYNFTSNALKFTSTGSVKVTATMEKTEHPNTAHITFAVRDTGIGISDEEQSRLFQRFSQANAAITRKFGGTGLGLSICKGLAKRMKGKIGCNSVVGKGSEFFISLCMKIVPDQRSVSEWRSRSRSNSITSSPSLESDSLQANRAIRILVVDDIVINQKIMCRILSGDMYEVTTAGNGCIAVELYEESVASGQPFDVILMDMVMPEMDGYEATSIIRELGYKRGIVAVTGSASTSDKRKCVAAGVDDFIHKPFRAERVSEVVTKWTVHFHLQKRFGLNLS